MKGIVLTAMDDEIYEVLSDNEIFADLFNGALFGGNQIIRPDMLEQENEKKVMRVGKEGGRRVILKNPGCAETVRASGELPGSCIGRRRAEECTLCHAGPLYAL